MGDKENQARLLIHHFCGGEGATLGVLLHPDSELDSKDGRSSSTVQSVTLISAVGSAGDSQMVEICMFMLPSRKKITHGEAEVYIFRYSWNPQWRRESCCVKELLWFQPLCKAPHCSLWAVEVMHYHRPPHTWRQPRTLHQMENILRWRSGNVVARRFNQPLCKCCTQKNKRQRGPLDTGPSVRPPSRSRVLRCVSLKMVAR